MARADSTRVPPLEWLLRDFVFDGKLSACNGQRWSDEAPTADCSRSVPLPTEELERLATPMALIAVLVSTGGEVVLAQRVQGDSASTVAALVRAFDCRFEPARFGGIPVPCKIVVPFHAVPSRPN